MKTVRPIIALMIGLYSQYSLAGPTELMSEYNLIVLGDLVSTSEVEGKSLVIGDLSGPASNYGVHLPTSNGHQDALVIGGDLHSGTTVNIKDGYGVTIGGAIDGTINPNHTSVTTDVSDYDFDLITSEFKNFSGYLSELASNSFLSTPISQPGAASFNVASINDDVAVFDIDSSDFFTNSLIQQYDIDFLGQSPSTIIINVAGERISDSSFHGNAVGNIIGDAFKELIIWNFYEALDINLSKQLNGTLLAPMATLTSYANIEGTVIVDDFYQNGEVHDNLFAGDIEDTPNDDVVVVPAPSSMLILFTSLLGMMAWRRRKSSNR